MESKYFALDYGVYHVKYLSLTKFKNRFLAKRNTVCSITQLKWMKIIEKRRYHVACITSRGLLVFSLVRQNIVATESEGIKHNGTLFRLIPCQKYIAVVKIFVFNAAAFTVFEFWRLKGSSAFKCPKLRKLHTGPALTRTAATSFMSKIICTSEACFWTIALNVISTILLPWHGHFNLLRQITGCKSNSGTNKRLLPAINVKNRTNWLLPWKVYELGT